MTPSDVFCQVVDLDEAGRLEILESCDPEVRREVESLLEHHDRSATFLEHSPLLEVPEDRLAPGARLGSYEILKVLGEGGMGVVYLARQERPSRDVALKVIRPGLATTRALERFEIESETLGRLQHPGIAQIFEAGRGETGIPFFAMELVRGVTITEASAGLDRDARLDLLADLCDAVHHAHEAGLIHRDLKPANVLVVMRDGKPSVKVLDFGVARLIGHDPSARGEGPLVGTVPYMSPEQLTDTDLDARSDVFALGVIAYELLGGVRPHDDASIESCIRAIREEAPRPLGELDRSLRGDIELVVHRALAKDREARYGSARELGADLRRARRHEPVSAHPASASYVARRFARRNPVLVGAAITILVLAGVGATVTTVLRSRADESEAASAQVADMLQGMIESIRPDQIDSDPESVRRVLGEVSARLEGSGVDAVRRASLHRSIARTYYMLTVYDRAREHIRISCRLFHEAKGPADWETLQSRWLEGVIEVDSGRPKEALEVLSDAYEVSTKAHGPDGRMTLAIETSLGITMEVLGDVDGAERIYRKALARSREMEEGASLMSSLQNLGLWLQDQERFDEAIELLRENLDLALEHHGEAHPETAGACLNLAVALLNDGQLEEAESLSERGIRISTAVQGDSHLVTLWLRANLAYVYHRQGRFELSEPLLRETLPAVEAIVERGAPLPIDIRLYLVYSMLAQERLEDARAEAEARHAIVVETYGAWPEVVGREVEAIARAFEASGAMEDAEAWRARR